MTLLYLALILAAASLGFIGGASLAWATRLPGETPEGWGFFLGSLGAALLVNGVDLAWVEVWLFVVEL